MIDKLLKYQEVDSKLRAIEIEISRSEERKKYAEAKKFIDNVNTNLAMLDAKAEELTVRYDTIKAAYSRLKENQSEYDNIIDTCEDENELNYVSKKAQELADKINDLSKNLDRIVADINSVIRDFNALRKNTSEYKKQYNEYGKKYFDLKKSKEGDMNEIKEQLAELEKGIDPAEMQKYKTKRADKIFPILYPVKNNHCTACGTGLSMIGYNNLVKNGMIECDNCRKIIYYVPETKAAKKK